MTAETRPCPNCAQRVEDHEQNGCVLVALIDVLRDRGEIPEERLRELHARCNPDALWEDVGEIVDRLGDGDYLEQED